jgi:hypothetical protein
LSVLMSLCSVADGHRLGIDFHGNCQRHNVPRAIDSPDSDLGWSLFPPAC